MIGTIELEQDTLFLACTRPAMIGGVTMEAMGINMIFTTILFIVAGRSPMSLWDWSFTPSSRQSSSTIITSFAFCLAG